MLFLVISTPAPSQPSAMRERREAYWRWIDAVRGKGQLRDAYSRAGRGAVAIFDVDGNEALHALINEWTEIVPAEFQVIPLIDPGAARAYLAPR
jgi:muconolactone delta-isomerase